MDVSVVLVTYNHEPFIAQAIDSVLSQTTDRRVEIVIAEDRSTDHTRRIVEGYAERFPERIRLLPSETNLGAVPNALRGLRAARGEFVAYLDGDDYWYPTKLGRQIAYLEDHPDEPMCYHAVDVLGDAPEGAERPYGRVTEVGQLLRHNTIPSGAVLYRREVLGEIPPWFADLDYGDWALVLLLAEHGNLGYLDEPLGVYRAHAGGMYSGASRLARRAADVRFFETMRQQLGPEHQSDVEVVLATARARLAREYSWAGQHRAALREAWTSLRRVPHRRELPAGDRLHILARSGAPRAYATVGRSLRAARRAAAPRAVPAQLLRAVRERVRVGAPATDGRPESAGPGGSRSSVPEAEVLDVG